MQDWNRISGSKDEKKFQLGVNNKESKVFSATLIIAIITIASTAVKVA